MYYNRGMTITTIGIRELQQHSSRLVRDVEQNDTAYRISLQGRDTGVILAKSATVRPPGATVAELRRRGLWNNDLPQSAKDRLLEFIEAGRDAVGRIGQ